MVTADFRREQPESARLFAEANEALRRTGIVERAVKTGDLAPEFALAGVGGETIRLGDLLGRGAVVLAFYRGGW